MTIAEDIFKVLRSEIIENILPKGEPLSENVIAKRFKSSRTPVREAIFRLESEQLVRIFSGRGAFVSMVDMSQVASVFQVRILLEPIAARTSFALFRESEIKDLEDQWLKLKDLVCEDDELWRKISTLDRQTHKFFTHKTPNQWLRSFLSVLDVHVWRMQNLAVAGLGESKESIRQHLELLNLAKSRDVEIFIAALVKHIADSEAYVQSYIELA